ncbi:MAG: acyl-CoA dehydratase activase [Dehalococcoidales bacterium]|nr:acyl-CoA dehydratase activase [Dehalococcoidales bacterium]
MKVYLGIDVGSVTTKLAALDEGKRLVASVYLPTAGKPVLMVQECLKRLRPQLLPDAEIYGVAATGSARYLAGVLIGADLVKNEITAHAVAALYYVPDARTVIEIGGQDSKIIIIKDGVVTDFGTNNACAAGTGSFLDHQAQRLGMSIKEFSRSARLSRNPVRIAGKCTVFAESDMVHKQQMGHRTEDIVYGLCQALVRNYISGVAAGKPIEPPVVFQGGVAFNEGMVRAFREELGQGVVIPLHHELMGAIGAALLVQEKMSGKAVGSCFKGFSVSNVQYQTSAFECHSCPNLCELAQVTREGKVLARWGGRCDIWERAPGSES